MPVIIQPGSTLYANRPSDAGDRFNVWMSHGDEAAVLPAGFSVVGRSEQGSVVAIEDPARKIFGLQVRIYVRMWLCVCGWVRESVCVSVCASVCVCECECFGARAQGMLASSHCNDFAQVRVPCRAVDDS
jgi:hypothetical protein